MLRYQDFQSYRENESKLANMAARFRMVLKRAQANVLDVIQHSPKASLNEASVRLSQLDIDDQCIATLVHTAQDNLGYIDKNDKQMARIDIHAYTELRDDKECIESLIEGLNQSISTEDVHRLQRLDARCHNVPLRK